MDIFTGTRKIHHRPYCSPVNLPACCFCQTVDERLVLAENESTILLQNHVENEHIANEMALFCSQPLNYEGSLLAKGAPTLRSSIYFAIASFFAHLV